MTLSAIRALIRRHPGIVVLLAIGAALRGLVMIGYRPAFWFNDTALYLACSWQGRPDQIHPFGFPAILDAFLILGRPGVMAFTQHLIGLAMAVGCYALAVRLGASRWLGVLAAVPVTLDAHQLTVEHYLLSDVWFTGLMLLAMLILLWRRRVTPVAGATAGLLLAGAVLVRPVGLALIGLALLYLLVCRTGWRPVATFAVAVLVPLAAYLAWFHHLYGRYAISGWTGRYLYARVAGFADCPRLDLAARLRRFCPTQPLGSRPDRPDAYLWTDAAPQVPDAKDADFRAFAVQVIVRQPGDYLWIVGRDTGRYFVPSARPYSEECLHRYWELPADPAGNALVRAIPPGSYRGCQPSMMTSGRFGLEPAARPVVHRTWLTTALHGYSRWVVMLPGPVLLLALLLGLAGAVPLRWFRRARHDTAVEAGDVLTTAVVTLSGLALVLLSVATSMYDTRYGLPALVLLPIAGALGAHRLVRLLVGRHR